MLFKHWPNVLRSIISIGADYFDCKTLYKTLSSSKCKTCDRFGGHLYLVPCKSVCHFFFTSDLESLPVLARYMATYSCWLLKKRT